MGLKIGVHSPFGHTCGDGGSLYKNVSELFFFPLPHTAERLCDCHHTSSFFLFFPSLLHYSGVCMQHCPSWVSQSPTGVSQSTHTYALNRCHHQFDYLTFSFILSVCKWGHLGVVDVSHVVQFNFLTHVSVGWKLSPAAIGMAGFQV